MKRYTPQILISLFLFGFVIVVGVFFYSFQISKKNDSSFKNNEDQSINITSELLMNEKFEEAEQFLQEYLRLNPKNNLLYYNLGIALMKQKKFKEAATSYTNSINIEVTQGALINRAYCYKVLGMNREAINDYSQIIDLYPVYSLAFLERGKLYMMLDEKEKAKTDFLSAKEKGIEQAQIYLEQL